MKQCWQHNDQWTKISRYNAQKVKPKWTKNIYKMNKR